jgi:hypothetical protein
MLKSRCSYAPLVYPKEINLSYQIQFTKEKIGKQAAEKAINSRFLRICLKAFKPLRMSLGRKIFLNRPISGQQQFQIWKQDYPISTGL